MVAHRFSNWKVRCSSGLRDTEPTVVTGETTASPQWIRLLHDFRATNLLRNVFTTDPLGLSTSTFVAARASLQIRRPGV